MKFFNCQNGFDKKEMRIVHTFDERLGISFIIILNVKKYMNKIEWLHGMASMKKKFELITKMADNGGANYEIKRI